MEQEKSAELRLAEAVAESTARRVLEGIRLDLQLRDEALQAQWRRDLADLRDDLTAKALITELNSQPAVEASMPVRVLVVDDSPEIRRAFVRIFGAAGMHVQDAGDGKSGAALLDNDHLIEVVVADISMPKNGYTLLEHVRKHYPIIEVVMTSGYELEPERARQLGAFGFLPKPFNITQAVLLVERAAEFRRLKMALTSKG